MAKKDSIFKISEAAEVLMVTPQTVRNWIDQGYLEAFRTAGGHRRIFKSELKEFQKLNNMI